MKVAVSVKREGPKVRIQFQSPASAEDPELVRLQHWDFPPAQALMIAAGIVTEVIGLMIDAAKKAPPPDAPPPAPSPELAATMEAPATS